MKCLLCQKELTKDNTMISCPQYYYWICNSKKCSNELKNIQKEFQVRKNYEKLKLNYQDWFLIKIRHDFL